MRTLHHRQGHLGWDRDLDPVLSLAAGDEVDLMLQDAGDGQLDSASTAADVPALDPLRTNPLTGPLEVVGAGPGDAVSIEVLGLASDVWGWTAVIPGFGLLQDDFPDPHLRHSRIREGQVEVDALARLPHRPFVGSVGVAPGTRGVHDAIPPRRVGGNLDLVDVAAGATLVLPVEVEGALLSLGDGHAAQGDGEVCGTAVETPTAVRIRVDVHPGAAPPAPQVYSDARPERPAGRVVTTTGVGPDLMVATRDAVRAMIARLERFGLEPVDAYLLCSVAGDLRIGEVVDAPNWVVAMTFPLDVLA